MLVSASPESSGVWRWPLIPLCASFDVSRDWAAEVCRGHTIPSACFVMLSVFVFYFHPSALNTYKHVLSAGSWFCNPVCVWDTLLHPPPAAEVYVGMSQTECTLQCPWKLWLGNYQVELHRWNAETETKRARRRPATSPHGDCGLLSLKRGTSTKLSLCFPWLTCSHVAYYIGWNSWLRPYK